MTTRRAVVLATLALSAGCGYGFHPGGGAIPAGARTISIALFENDTRERAIEVSLRRAIEEEFRRQGTLRVVDHDADLRLEGRLRHLRNVPVAFSGADQAVEFQAQLVVGVRLVDARTGKALLNARQVHETADFAADPNVVISTSPAFQEQTANARDVAQLTSVALSESTRAEARRRLVDQMAEQVYLITMEGF